MHIQRKGSSYVLVAFMLVVILLNCQHHYFNKPQVAISKLPIDSSANAVQFFSPQAYAHFLDALDSLMRFQHRAVHILHLGDSHIQADFFPNRVRKQMQMHPLVGSAGRGFFFPARLAHAGKDPLNVPKQYVKGAWLGCRGLNVRMACHIGLSGMSASTYQLSAVFRFATDSFYTDCRRLRVYYDTQSDSSFYPVVWAGVRWHQPYRIHRDGYAEFRLMAPPPYTIALQRFRLQQYYFRLYGLLLDNEKPGVLYHSAGMNGATLNTYLHCSHCMQHLSSLQPDLVIVSLGTNDAHRSAFNAQLFKQQYQELIAYIRLAAPNASILLTTPGDSYFAGRPNDNIAKAAEVLYQLAKEEGLLLWDWYKVMGGSGSIRDWQKAGVASSDLVHLLEAGYLIQGDLLYTALMDLYAKVYNY